MPVRGPIFLPIQPNASAAGNPTNCVIRRAVISADWFSPSDSPKSTAILMTVFTPSI